jgi:Uma2 family endonuclease
MATVIEKKPEAPHDAFSSIVSETRIAIEGVSYEFYKQFCDEVGEQPIRLSYNDGCLEIMVTKSSHEFFKKMLAKLVEATVFELNIPVRSGGAMTFQRDDLKKGFEPDECWWLAHESIVRKTTDFDFQKDPPPDLAIEVEVSHSLAGRIHILAAIKIPEVWRYDGRTLRFCILDAEGQYVDAECSKSFPFLRPELLQAYLALPDEEDETTRLRKYVNWLRSLRFD